jgi:hypothetical protein
MSIPRATWRMWTDVDTVRRRAAGRRKYNVWRAEIMQARRDAVLEYLRLHGECWGVQRQITGEFGVHPATVCRDIRALRRQRMWW